MAANALPMALGAAFAGAAAYGERTTLFLVASRFSSGQHAFIVASHFSQRRACDAQLPS